MPTCGHCNIFGRITAIHSGSSMNVQVDGNNTKGKRTCPTCKSDPPDRVWWDLRITNQKVFLVFCEVQWCWHQTLVAVWHEGTIVWTVYIVNIVSCDLFTMKYYLKNCSLSSDSNLSVFWRNGCVSYIHSKHFSVSFVDCVTHRV